MFYLKFGTTGQAMQITLSSFLRLVGDIPKPFEITLRVAARFCETLGLLPAQFPENKKDWSRTPVKTDIRLRCFSVFFLPVAVVPLSFLHRTRTPHFFVRSEVPGPRPGSSGIRRRPPSSR